MAGFHPDIPIHLFEGAEIWTITVGAYSITFDLFDGNRIMLQPYGVTEDRRDWLYNMKLSGENSVQGLVGQTIQSITVLTLHHAQIRFSGGRVLDLVHDDPLSEIASFTIGGDEYHA